MINYIGNILKYLLEEIKSYYTTPAAEHLLQVIEGDKVKPPPKEHAVTLHHTVVHILF